MEQMINKKNEKLKEAGDAMHEIWDITLMLENVSVKGSSYYQTLVKLATERIGILTYGWEKYIEEAELYLPEAEEGVEDDSFLTLPTEDEITAAREENGDD